MKVLPLRDYQEAALAARDEHTAQRAAIVLPTGAGKTVCFAHQALREPGRMLVLVHTTELAQQAADKIRKVAPHLEAGIFMGTTKEIPEHVMVGGVQTVVRHLDKVGRFTHIIVDECHHAAADSYIKILQHLRAFEPNGPRVTGYTATLGRNDERALGHVWQDVAFSRDISWMIRRRYLIPPFGRIVRVPDLDLAAVRSTRTDYRDGELGDALAESLAPELVAQAYVEHGSGRRAIGFAPTVSSAEVFAKAFEREGVLSGVVHGGMPRDERERVLAAHRAGDFPVLWNCMVLTEGYDDPAIGCVILARPTKSRNLYQQMVGRGLRVDVERDYDGQDCLLLAVVPEALGHDLCSIIDLSTRPLPEAVEGKTLVELEDELDAMGGVPEDVPAVYRGPVEVREFDPMGRPTTKVWLRTAAGTYFMQAGRDVFVFIHPFPRAGEWSVSSVHKRWGLPTMSEYRGLPLDQALVWAQDLALVLGADLNTMSRSASWRKRPASEAMRKLALDLGLKVAEGEKGGAVSDRITVVLGSRRIDPLVRALAR